MNRLKILILATSLLIGCPKASENKAAEEQPPPPWPKRLEHATRLHRSIDGDYGVVCYSLVRPGHAGSVYCVKVTVDPIPERPAPDIQMNPW